MTDYPSTRNILVSALHLLTLAGFFIAQPLFSLLAGNGEFFIARAAAPLDVLVFAVLATTFPALVLILAELFFALFGERSRNAAQVTMVVILVFLGTLPALGAFSTLSGAAVIAVSSATGLLFGWAYIRFQTLRTILTYASIAILFFPLAFLFTPDIRDIAFPSQNEVTDLRQSTGNDISVVLIIFDEFTTTSLMTQERLVDAELFPNLAWLADRSHWFRNATSVASGTVDAVPAILSGRYAFGGQPTVRDYPDNLFTLLGDKYNYNVHESASRLCPPQFCPEQIRDPFLQRITSLLVDVSIVFSHIVTPEDYADFLPDISQGWDNFLGAPGGDTSGEIFADGWLNFVQSNFRDDREFIWHRFTAAIPTGKPSLNVLHALLPHVPLEFLPSGRKYSGQRTRGLKNEKWLDDEWAVKQIWQRHLMQVVHTDRLLGEVFQELRQKGLFDDALIIVTADHGVSFKTGGFRRPVTLDNFMDILPVPLFIKVPGQQQGSVSDDSVETVDVLPTILEILALEIPSSVEGFSVFDTEGRAERQHKRMWDKRFRKTYEFPNALEEKYETLDERLALFSDVASPDRLFFMGSDKQLIGQNVSDLPADSADRYLVLIGSEYRSQENWVTGTISGLPPKDATVLHLALSVNGFIKSVTKTFAPNADGYRDFAFLVPESAYTETGNDIGIWVKGDKGWSVLERTVYAIIDENGEYNAIQGGSGVRYPIIPGVVRGHVDHVVTENGSIWASGWAVDVSDGAPVETVLLFNDGEFVSATSPNIRRKDVARAIGRTSLKSGFDISGIDKSRWPFTGEFTFFGVTHDGTAGALRFGD